MTLPTKIDTTNLLTILSVIAAVWALITPTKRLLLQFGMAWWDWVIVLGVFALSNYLVFAPTLKALGFYYSFGPWKWGLDSSSAVYLLLLSVSFYLCLRFKSPKLLRGKINNFRMLLENLHLTKQYEDLVRLLEPQLDKLLFIIKNPPFIARKIDGLYNIMGNVNLAEVMIVESSLIRCLQKKLRLFRNYILNRDDSDEQAREVLLNVLTSPELTRHLAQTHPHFCLKLIKCNEVFRTDFTADFISALLNSPNSRLYVELKNNLNTNGGSRLAIPKTNRLLHFLFSNAEFAKYNDFSRAIGETLFWRLDEDNRLAEVLNKPLGSYGDIGKFQCPIYSGITMFEIMVHEGIHQVLHDHLWLHYYKHFAEKILKKMTKQDEDIWGEWQTPFHYLLCHLFKVATNWSEQCAYINYSEILKKNQKSTSLDPYYISKESTKLLGSMLELIIPSDKLILSSKKEILETVVRCYTRLERNPKLRAVADSLLISTTKGDFNMTKASYRKQLLELFDEIDDHRVRGDAPKFRKAIESAIEVKPE
ncbi:hypothetical protein [Serratia marcescens]|uniref:hypothetical protein n=1 Tax=Serratia marcescens TaxID=615 RepID=UPI001BD22777|nr:hypothetical protein [Serratia marcescens]